MIDLSETPLVETGWLAAHLSDPNLRLVDARWRGDGSGPVVYRAGHIPGAVYLSWATDLAYTAENGVRWVLLPPDRFATVVGAAGIGPETRVVVHAERDESGAARLWWALRYYGHEQVAVLNGGLTRWRAENRPLSTEVTQPPPARFKPHPRPHLRATAAEIEAILANPTTDVCLVDTRPLEQYRGQAVWTPQGSLYLPEGQDWVEVEPGRAMRGGRIPGAISQHAVKNLNPADDWRYQNPETLRAQAEKAGLKPEQRVITYCGCGISASLTLFALYVAGYRDLALYDASWEEWGTDPARPIERPKMNV